MGENFERDVMFLMHDVARLMRVEADRRARVNGMTRAQWSMLLRLAIKPGLSQKELADLLEVEPISVARMIDRLEASGLVERRADEHDRRVWRLHLRPEATAQLEAINRQRQEMAHFSLDGVPPAVREAMIEGLIRMKANFLKTGEPGAASRDRDPAAGNGACALDALADVSGAGPLSSRECG